MEIFKEFSFDAAHRLVGLPDGHKCARVHGHTYRLRVHVAGEVGGDSGWIVDFADLSKTTRGVIDQLDHQMLNEIPGLSQPTVERIAEWIWDRLQPDLPGLCRLTIWEGVSAGCTYTGKGAGRPRGGAGPV